MGIVNKIIKNTNKSIKGLGWLDQYHHMLQPYGHEGKYAHTESGAKNRENSITSK